MDLDLKAPTEITVSKANNNISKQRALEFKRSKYLRYISYHYGVSPLFEDNNEITKKQSEHRNRI